MTLLRDQPGDQPAEKVAAHRLVVCIVVLLL
jgi:hypothetical protein